MDRLRSESGSGLIMLIGISAALAVLAIALVGVVGNSQHFSLKDRNRALAFNAAEAGLDLGQAALWEKWPGSSAQPQAPLGTAAFGAPFTSQSGFSGSVVFFDDIKPDDMIPYDTSSGTEAANGYMYIRSTATVGGVEASVQAMVQKVELPLRLKEDTALFTVGPLTINGGGAGTFPVGSDPPASSATIYGTSVNPNGNMDYPNLNYPVVVGSPLTVEDVFPSDIITMLTDEAKLAGQYFTNEAALTANNYAGLQRAISKQPHIIVIENGDLKLPFPGSTNSNPLWTETDPGIIILLGKDGQGTLTFAGNQAIWGVLYANNIFNGSGTMDVHGMVVAKNGGTLSGSRTLNYNANVISNLNKMVTQSVKVVPNTWREIQPQ